MDFSELFVFVRSSEIFLKKTEFLNSRNFREKVWKKVWILTEIVCQFQNFWKNYVKFEFLSQKNLFLGQKFWKILEKVWKKFGKVWKQGFPNIRKLFYSELSKNYEKWRLNRTSEITKNSFRLKNRLESSVKSLECRALIWCLLNFHF